MTKRSTGRGQGRAIPNTKTARKPAKATARRQLMGMCEKVEVLLLAMSGLAGSVLAYEIEAVSDRLHAVVMAG